MLAEFELLPIAFWSPGPGEMLVLAVVALLLYGGNLPEVARSWGKSFAEFRRGLSGFQNELNSVIYSDPEQLPYHSDEPGRDDSRFVSGYEEASYADADEPDSDETDDGEKTVNEASADTIVIENNEHDKASEEKPA